MSQKFPNEVSYIFLYCILKYQSYIGYFYLSYWASLPLSDGERGNGVNSESDDKVDVEGDRSNFYGVNYIMWFDIGIEGKDSMNPEEWQDG